MTRETILIVDDDPEIIRLLSGYLEQASYSVYSAEDGEVALQLLRERQPDALILDLMLPDRDGWNLTRVIRSDDRLRSLPIIMLTARVTDADKILGLELGADDYITKPFNPREVVARVNALFRRLHSNEGDPHILEAGDIRMILETREVTVKGKRVDLTPTEYKLLRVMVEQPGYVFTREDLIDYGLGFEYEGVRRTMDSHIKNLRQKIEPDPKKPVYVCTVWGVGYKINVVST